MRKIVHIILVLIPLLSRAQFFQGVGIYGAGNSSRHWYSNSNPVDSTNRHAMPESHRSAEFLNWGLGVKVELLPFKSWRWISDISYSKKGANENELLNPWTDQHRKGTNKYTYFSFNNYLMFRLEGFSLVTYALAGARLEYNWKKSIGAYSAVADNFKRIWVTPDFGFGLEPASLGRLRIFTELHYNPDILKQYNKDNVWAKNRTWELRVGLMLRNRKSLDLDCNAPTYSDPY